MDKLKSIDKKTILLVVVAFLIGVIWLIAMRFIIYKESNIHYHANYAVFVDGKRLPFDKFTFYEEIASCGGEEEFNPKTRTHMHEQVNHVIHVHDASATWGHFFANIGFANGDTVFKTDTETYLEDKKSEIRFILNGEEVDTTANRTIQSEDALLVSIGKSTDEQIDKQYEEIKKDAGEYNLRNDPASCSGGGELTFTEKLKKSIGLFND